MHIPKLPSLPEKISQTELKSSPTIGRGVDFESKFAIFKQRGCFGGRDMNSHRAVKEHLYEEPTERFENLLRGKTNFIQKELDYFRLCLEFVSDEEIALSISDQQLLTDKADILFDRLARSQTILNWDGYDPVPAILNLAVSREKLALKIEVSKKFGELETTPELQKHELDDIVELTKNDSYYLDVKKYLDDFTLVGKPIILDIGYRLEQTMDFEDFRAQQVTTVTEKLLPQKENEKNAYWRCSRSDKSQIPVFDIKGLFVFLAIGNAGPDIGPWLPEGANPERLSNDDLQYMFEKLVQVSKGRNDIVYGTLAYQVL